MDREVHVRKEVYGYGAITYIINEQGIIEEIIGKVDTRNHADQILKNGPAKTVQMAKKTRQRKRQVTVR